MNIAFPDPEFLRRTLEEYARGYASLAAAIRAPRPSGPAGPEALWAPLQESYRQLFQPPGFAGPSDFASAAAPAAKSASALVRYREAWERCSRLASAIALDASHRLSAALAATGPGVEPIASLRQLHALWIECGEAAYGDAAHTEEFATAQAELLGALVELKAATT